MSGEYIPNRGRASARITFKDVDALFNEISGICQNFDNRLTLENRRLCDRYREGKLQLVLKARLGDAEEFCIVLERADNLGASHGGQTNIDHTIGANGRPVAGEYGLDPASRDCGPYHHNSLVFVQVVQPVEQIEHGATKFIAVPSVIRLKPADQLFSFPTDPFYFFGKVGFKRFSASGDQKAVRLADAFTVRNDKVADEVVEGGPQVVGDVTDDGAPRTGDIFFNAHPYNYLVGIRIFLTEQDVWVSLNQVGAELMEFTDMAFGPFDLESGPLEEFYGHGSITVG
ncbi:MAG: hypothetical protein RO009_15980 [Pseudorhodoplanes sp.]|nr:hypothetical protein [Pseudorhodoplanes sp.]